MRSLIDHCDSLDSLDSLDLLNSLDSLDSLDSLYSLYSLDLLELLESLDVLESLESLDLLEIRKISITHWLTYWRLEIKRCSKAHQKTFLRSKPSCAYCVYVVAVGTIINNQILHVFNVFMMMRLLVIVSLSTILLPFPIPLNPQGSWLWMGSFQAWTGR